jgi:hypothetical protein
MGSFGKSFDEAFKPAFTTAQAGTLDAIKERIKLDATKSDDTKKVTSYLNLAIDSLKETDEGTQKRMGAIIGDKTQEWTPDSAKALYEQIQESRKNQREIGEKIKTTRYTSLMEGSNKVLDRLAEQGGIAPAIISSYKAQMELDARKLSGLDSGLDATSTSDGIQKPEGFNDFMNKPMKSKAELEGEAASSKKLNERNLNRQELSKELNDFFLVDDQLPRTDEGFVGRTMQGIQSTAAGMDQSTAQGFAIATHDALKKRLRVRLVRAAGDVGNINIVEQSAAEQIIPGKWDAAGTAKLKRAFLKKASEALTTKEGPELESEIKNILNDFAKTKAFDGPKGEEANKVTGKFKVGDVREKNGVSYERQKDGTWKKKSSKS